MPARPSLSPHPTSRRRKPRWRWIVWSVAIPLGAVALLAFLFPDIRIRVQADLCDRWSWIPCPAWGGSPVTVDPVNDPLHDRLVAVDSEIRVLLRSNIRDSLDSAMSVNVWKKPYARSRVDSVGRVYREHELVRLKTLRDSLLVEWKKPREQ